MARWDHQLVLQITTAMPVYVHLNQLRHQIRHHKLTIIGRRRTVLAVVRQAMIGDSKLKAVVVIIEERREMVIQELHYTQHQVHHR